MMKMNQENFANNAEKETKKKEMMDELIQEFGNLDNAFEAAKNKEQFLGKGFTEEHHRLLALAKEGADELATKLIKKFKTKKEVYKVLKEKGIDTILPNANVMEHALLEEAQEELGQKIKDNTGGNTEDKIEEAHLKAQAAKKAQEAADKKAAAEKAQKEKAAAEQKAQEEADKKAAAETAAPTVTQEKQSHEYYRNSLETETEKDFFDHISSSESDIYTAVIKRILKKKNPNKQPQKNFRKIIKFLYPEGISSSKGKKIATEIKENAINIVKEFITNYKEEKEKQLQEKAEADKTAATETPPPTGAGEKDKAMFDASHADATKRGIEVEEGKWSKAISEIGGGIQEEKEKTLFERVKEKFTGWLK